MKTHIVDLVALSHKIRVVNFCRYATETFKFVVVDNDVLLIGLVDFHARLVALYDAEKNDKLEEFGYRDEEMTCLAEKSQVTCAGSIDVTRSLNIKWESQTYGSFGENSAKHNAALNHAVAEELKRLVEDGTLVRLAFHL